jgi:single-strand DNA-binding protein
MANFTVANNHGYGEHKQVCFLKCIAFGKSAEAMSKYTSKGSPVILRGTLSQETWQDKDTGAKRPAHKMLVDAWEFNGPKKEAEQKQAAPAQVDEAPAMFEDADIPF